MTSNGESGMKLLHYFITAEQQMKYSAQLIIESLLSDQKLLPLSAFKSNKYSKYSLFPEAKRLPTFFQYNLLNEGRVVKVLRGSEGVLRGFYYQLLKLGFEIESQRVDFSSMIKNVIFDRNLIEQSGAPVSGKKFNILQYCRIIIEFMHHLESQVIPNCDLSISQFPIIDEAFITVLELIIDRQHTSGHTTPKNSNTFTVNELLAELSGLFSISYEIYENCFSFTDSDVFIYAEDETDIYLAYLSEMAEVESLVEESSAVDQHSDHRRKGDFSSNSFIQSNEYSDQKDSSAKKRQNFRLSAGNNGRYRPRDIPYLNKKALNGGQPHRGETASLTPNSQRQKQIFFTSQKIMKSHEKSVSSKSDHIGGGIQFSDSRYTPEKNVFDSNSSSREIPYAELSESSRGSKKPIGSKGKLIKQQRISELEREYEQSQDTGQNSREIQRKSRHRRDTNDEGRGQHKRARYEVKEIQSISEIGVAAYSEGRSHSPTTTNQGDQISVMEYKGKFLPRKDSQNESSNLHDSSALLYGLQNPKIVKTQSLDSFKKSRQQISEMIQSTPYFKDAAANQKIVKTTTDNTFKFPVLKPEHIGSTSITRIQAAEDLMPAQTFKKTGTRVYPSEQSDFQFYKPSQKMGANQKNMPELVTPTFSKITNLEQTNNQQLGTFYREFSDTKIMEVMPEPFRTRVKATRSKFLGVRSKNFMGLLEPSKHLHNEANIRS